MFKAEDGDGDSADRIGKVCEGVIGIWKGKERSAFHMGIVIWMLGILLDCFCTPRSRPLQCEV
jgi:hypothetical protein